MGKLLEWAFEHVWSVSAGLGVLAAVGTCLAGSRSHWPGIVLAILAGGTFAAASAMSKSSHYPAGYLIALAVVVLTFVSFKLVMFLWVLNAKGRGGA